MTAEIKQTEQGSLIGTVEFLWARNSKEFLFANSIFIKGSTSYIVDPSATFTYIEGLAMSHAVDIVLNTHYHGDHRSLNSLFKNVRFAAHELDAPAIRDNMTYEQCADSDQHSFYTEWRKQFFKQYHILDCPVSVLYKGNEVLDTGDEEIELLHLPGHTPGHMALFFRNIKTLFVSDIDLTPYGPWYANVASSIEDFIESVKKIREVEADFYVSSHGERIYDREKFLEKLDRFNRHFFERDEKILDLLKLAPRKIEEFLSEGIVYRRQALVDPLKYYFQWKMIEKHLEKLIKEKKIVLQDNVYYLS